MISQAATGTRETTIEGLRLEIRSQYAKVRIAPAATCSSLEIKLLVAMQQNLEIMMTNQSINPSQGASK